MKTSPWRRASPVVGLLVAGCASEPRTITIEVVTGHEETAFRDDPPVASIAVTATAVEGDVTVSASAPPGGTLDFGEIPANRGYSFEVRGVDASGAVVVRGRSLSGIYISSLISDVLPIFAQRTGRWARPPGELPASREAAPGVVLEERFLTITGGRAAESDVEPARVDSYDLLAWGGAASESALPRAARSLVARGSAVLVIAEKDATWAHVTTGQTRDVPPPEGLDSFAEVAGGRTIDGSDGRSFVVGATRSALPANPPSDAVLIADQDGKLSSARLTVPRAAAAAVWVEGLGLVVAGGSATGAGVEVLAPGATAFVPRPFPEDPSEGAGAVVSGAGEIVLVGGTLAGEAAPTRRLAPGCTAGCAVAEIGGATLPALVDVAAFALPGGRVLAVGSEVDGERLTRSFLVDLAAATSEELPLREPRRGATVLPAPNGTLSLLGGVHPDGTPALAVEMFFPE